MHWKTGKDALLTREHTLEERREREEEIKEISTFNPAEGTRHIDHHQQAQAHGNNIHLKEHQIAKQHALAETGHGTFLVPLQVHGACTDASSEVLCSHIKKLWLEKATSTTQRRCLVLSKDIAARWHSWVSRPHCKDRTGKGRERKQRGMLTPASEGSLVPRQKVPVTKPDPFEDRGDIRFFNHSITGTQLL
eukprot:1147227-Pelagomonas_calceolata.AAC.3